MSSSSSSTLAYRNLSTKTMYKKTDFRLALWKKERKNIKKKAKKNSYKVEKIHYKSNIIVNTSNAKSNLNIVRLALKKLGFSEGEKNSCIYWTSYDFEDIGYSCKINKFPGMIDCLKKACLTRNLDVMKRLFPDDYKFNPKSWILPDQFDEWHTYINKSRENNKYFIVKPDSGTQGNGIYLINDPSKYRLGGRVVVQKYLNNPLLIDGFKFDLRIYVLISDIHPLTVYLYKEGLVRLCSEKYQLPNANNANKTCIHLTNYSVNKHNTNYHHSINENDGNKRSLTAVFNQLKESGKDVSLLWSNITDVVIKTCVSICSQLQLEFRLILPRPKPFQIIGFDLLVLNDLKVKLLEVNACPSLRIDHDMEIIYKVSEQVHSPVDENIKLPLVMETLKLIANNDYDKSLLQNVLPDVNYKHLYLIQDVLNIFIKCLGIRATSTMDHSSFRNFIRQCQINHLNSVNVDLLYLETQRRWQHISDTNYLCFQGFLDIFITIANLLYDSNLVENVITLVEFCQRNSLLLHKRDVLLQKRNVNQLQNLSIK